MGELFNYWWPVFMIVGGDVLYQICAKKMAKKGNPIAALGLLYFSSAILCAILFELFVPGGGIFQAILQSPAGAIIMGISMVGLEIGAIYIYVNGWAMNVGFTVYTSLIVIALLLFGTFFYGEPLSLQQILGCIVASIGTFMIAR